MKKLLALFKGRKSSAEERDPGTVLFSLPTLSGDNVAREPLEGPPGPDDLVFHEDDWRQIELFPASRAAEIVRVLGELKSFEAVHRRDGGYAQVFRRKLAQARVLGGSPETLGQMFGAKAGAGPVLFYGADTVTGRVADGFSLPLAGKAALYGTRDMTVLGAAMPAGASSEVLARAFVGLNRSDGLILVDWRSQMLLLKVADDGNLEVWRP
jgi:hypothetical protein